MTSGFDLLLVPPSLRDDAIDDLTRGDVLGVLIKVGNERAIEFVARNVRPLQEVGLYEQALIDAFVSTRTNHSHWRLEILGCLFRAADRARLLGAGDPLPDRRSFPLYRAIAGTGSRRKPAGFSWTSSLRVARFFVERAKLWGLHDPCIVTTTARRGDVLAYCDRRREREFLYLAKFWKRFEVVS